MYEGLQSVRNDNALENEKVLKIKSQHKNGWLSIVLLVVIFYAEADCKYYGSIRLLQKF